MKVSAYPLQWPDGWRRTEPNHRGRAKFNKKTQSSGGSWQTSSKLTIHDAVNRLLQTFDLMGIDTVDDVVISTDLVLRLDGLPRSGQSSPDDPGVAAYWVDASGDRRCMAVDRYDRIADNIAAVAATLEAMRAIERHGGAEILSRAFTGFVALPAPAQWWHVMGFESAQGLSLEDVENRYRALAMQRHPDRDGGDANAMAELTWAREQARAQLC